ncbi:MAG: YggS family pyridoxal phosphate-dependent enzyme [Candidatus Sericytochromatia bacterium]
MTLGFTVEENIKHFFEEIPSSVEIIAVTKTVDVDRIKLAAKAGIKNIGENKVQEALNKFNDLKDFNLKWHLIGSLQSNKAKKAVEIFDLIHSIDSVKLANVVNKEAEKLSKVQNVLLQVNVSREETKSGFSIEDLFKALTELSCLKNLNIIGLMTIGSNTDDENQIRFCFSELRKIKDKINKDKYFKNELNILSMGMSNDYKIAIEEGANFVRLGRAIFGERK